MKQCIDRNGNIMEGLFKRDDGSIVNTNSEMFKQVSLQQSHFDELNNTVEFLKQQVITLTEMVKNGRR